MNCVNSSVGLGGLFGAGGAGGGLGGRVCGGWGGDGVEVGFAFGQLHEEILAGEGRGVFEELAGADVAAVGLLEAGLDGVGEIGGENFVVDAGAGGGVADGEDDFAALEEVAGHPVGGAEVDFVVAAVGEVEDAGVLEEAADDGADADALGQAFDAGAEDARGRGR